MISIDEIKEKLKNNRAIALKYVKTDQFKFAETTQDYPEHRDMVGKNEIAKSAGFCIIVDQLIMVTGNSMSLGIGPAPEDEKEIKILLNL